MADPRGPVRALAAVLAVLCALAAGCAGSDTDRARDERSLEGLPVHTDLEPLRRRFPELGRMVDAHWQERVIGDGSWWPPGPSDTLFQAVIVLAASDLERIKAEQSWEPARQGWDGRLTGELRPFLPPSGDWRHSALLEADVRAPLYTGGGDVIVDLRLGVVYLNLYTA